MTDDKLALWSLSHKFRILRANPVSRKSQWRIIITRRSSPSLQSLDSTRLDALRVRRKKKKKKKKAQKSQIQGRAHSFPSTGPWSKAKFESEPTESNQPALYPRGK